MPCAALAHINQVSEGVVVGEYGLREFGTVMLLLHFIQFGRHASQGLWSWPKSVACPVSQASAKPESSDIDRSIIHSFTKFGLPGRAG